MNTNLPTGGKTQASSGPVHPQGTPNARTVCVERLQKLSAEQLEAKIEVLPIKLKRKSETIEKRISEMRLKYAAYEDFKRKEVEACKRLFAGELLIDMYATEAKDRHSSSGSKTTFLPMTRNYHHDLHTGHGKSIWVNCFAEAWKAKCFQFGNLDSRFSGSVISNLWREKCYRQYGSMKKNDGSDWHWSDVLIPDGKYVNAMAVERHYYQAVIEKIENRHPNLVLNSDNSLSD